MTGNNIADKITSISKKSPVHSNNGISKKIANLLDKNQIKNLNLEQKIGLNQMMNQEEHTLL